MVQNRLILTDCDGVLLFWEHAFDICMQHRGFQRDHKNQNSYDIGLRYGISDALSYHLVKAFNESAAIGFLPALRDAVHFVKKLHFEHGYRFHCITSLSTKASAQELRLKNLNTLFGEGVFEKIIFLETSASKEKELEAYKDSGLFWIEDLIDNAEVGNALGLRSILMAHGYNDGHENPNIEKVTSWKEIYDLVLQTHK